MIQSKIWKFLKNVEQSHEDQETQMEPAPGTGLRMTENVIVANDQHRSFAELEIVKRQHYTNYFIVEDGRRVKLLLHEVKKPWVGKFYRKYDEDFSLMDPSERQRLKELHRKFYCQKCGKKISKATWAKHSKMGYHCMRKTKLISKC